MLEHESWIWLGATCEQPRRLMWDKRKFCHTHRSCYSVQFSRSSLLWRDISDRGHGAALRFVGWVWMLCDNASKSLSKLKRCRGSPGRGQCRQSVGVFFLPVPSLGRHSTLSGMERLASYPAEQQIWLQKWNKFLIVLLSSLSFRTSSLLLSLNNLSWPVQFSFFSCDHSGHPALKTVNTNLPFKTRKHSFPQSCGDYLSMWTSAA